MKKVKYMGIDVGVNGGIAFYDGKKLKTYKMPTIWTKVNERNKRTYDIDKIKEIIKTEEPNIAIIERVWSLPSDGRVGAFSFGYGYGLLTGICESYIGNVIHIPSHIWKKHFNLYNKKSKKEAVELCNKIFGTNFKVKDDGEAEALLLIKYYMEVNENEKGKIK